MMSKKSMVMTTIILTSITLIFMYIDYTQGRLFNLTLIVLCVLDAVLIIGAAIMLFGDTKIETWVNNKWDQMGFENQQEIRAWVQIMLFVVFIIVMCLCFNSIYMRS